LTVSAGWPTIALVAKPRRRSLVDPAENRHKCATRRAEARADCGRSILGSRALVRRHMRGSAQMATWTPDPSFYPSPRLAMKAPKEKLAYVASFDPTRKRPDELAVVDVEAGSRTFGKIVGEVKMPNAGDELHHFGWNACSSCLCPSNPHPHVERRYLIVPGLRSSRIHVIDTKPDPKKPKIVKVIEPSEVAERSGATPGRTPCIAVPKASTSPRSAIRRATGRAASW
jgi:hypothetical protein